MIAIVDYQMGNLRSVQKGFERIGHEATITSDARDIEANSVVDAAPGMIAAALEHSPGDNGNALALANLRDMTIDSLIGLSLTDTIVRENLEVQQQQISGVNADEETINLLSYQRVYHGSARFIAVVDELLQKLLAIV